MPPVCRWIWSSVTLVVTELVSLSLHPSSNFATLNKVPASFGWGKGENVTSAVWQVTLWCHSDVWVPITVRCVACYFSLLSNVCACTHTPVNCHFQVNLEVCQSRMDAPLLLFFPKMSLWLTTGWIPFLSPNDWCQCLANLVFKSDSRFCSLSQKLTCMDWCSRFLPLRCCYCYCSVNIITALKGVWLLKIFLTSWKC